MEEIKINQLGVIGVGFMGGGIAQVSAMAGLRVKIYDVRREAISKCLETISWSLAKLKSKGKFRGEIEEALKRIKPINQLEELNDAELVIEAIYENVQVKQELLEKLGKILAPSAIIGSNTSSIPMTVLSQKLPFPENFIGTHFFGPVPLMALVELVMAPKTSEATLETIKAFVRTIGKTPIVVRKPSPGFLVNRIWFATALEALRCYNEGIGTPEDIDTGMRLGYGFSAGPFEVMDNAGLDVIAGVFRVLGAEPPEVIKKLIASGHLGRKTGQGFYRYGADGKKIPS